MSETCQCPPIIADEIKSNASSLKFQVCDANNGLNTTTIRTVAEQINEVNFGGETPPSDGIYALQYINSVKSFIPITSEYKEYILDDYEFIWGSDESEDHVRRIWGLTAYGDFDIWINSKPPEGVTPTHAIISVHMGCGQSGDWRHLYDKNGNTILSAYTEDKNVFEHFTSASNVKVPISYDEGLDKYYLEFHQPSNRRSNLFSWLQGFAVVGVSDGDGQSVDYQSTDLDITFLEHVENGGNYTTTIEFLKKTEGGNIIQDESKVYNIIVDYGGGDTIRTLPVNAIAASGDKQRFSFTNTTVNTLSVDVMVEFEGEFGSIRTLAYGVSDDTLTNPNISPSTEIT